MRNTVSNYTLSKLEYRQLETALREPIEAMVDDQTYRIRASMHVAEMRIVILGANSMFGLSIQPTEDGRYAVIGKVPGQSDSPLAECPLLDQLLAARSSSPTMRAKCL